jgi:hypothetical protein
LSNTITGKFRRTFSFQNSATHPVLWTRSLLCFSGFLDAMNVLFILNDSPYTSQRSYNGLRLALSMTKSAPNKLRVFLFGDGVICGLGQPAPLNAFYNVQELLNGLASATPRSAPARPVSNTEASATKCCCPQ